MGTTPNPTLTASAAGIPMAKFIPFIKVDAVKREVTGIVTAERPDKDLEVCDYEKSKPFYQTWSAEFAKTTDGKSFGNLRAMHQLDAVGKASQPIDFNDDEKQIVMTFKVVDDDAWKKVDERVYTGFSQGGRKVGEMTKDPVYKGCMRYVANPSEVSLVDNPCLPDAHFMYVKADGSIEMRKFLKVETPENKAELTDRITQLEQQLALVKAAQTAPVTAAATPAAAGLEAVEKAKTKRVAGEDLTSSAFAYVGDKDKTETWKLPIKFSSDDKTKRHIRNALARLNQTEGIPAAEKPKVRAKIVAAARKHGIDVAGEEEKVAAIRATMRKAVRVYVNTHLDKIKSPGLLKLDTELGKLSKGMWEVARLASLLDDASWLVFAIASEQEFEGDEDSPLPDMMAENVSALTETLLEMVDEEARELLEHVHARIEAK